MKNKNQCLLPVFMTAIVLLFCSAQLWAQSSDTLFVIEEEFVYDTLFVHDTLHIHDTITIDDYIHSPEFEQLFYNSEFIDSQTFPDSLKKIFKETVTFWENNVFDIKQEKFSNMDSIKKYGLVGLIILGLNAFAPAQQDSTFNYNQNKDIYPKHELCVSYGVMPIIGVFYLGNYDDVYPFYENRIVKLGCINTQYRICFNPTHSLNFNFSWAVYEHTLKVRQSGIYNNSNVHHLTFQIGYSVRYFKREAVSLYSSIYGGFVLSSIGRIAVDPSNEDELQYNPNNICLFHPAFHLTILGVRLGRKNAAHFELGFGTQGVFNFGYNYKF